MKKLNYKKAFATLGLILFQVSLLLADNSHPPVPKGNNEGFDDCCAVGGPIDSYLPLLFMAALVLGALAITKIKAKKLADKSI
jgi:hypothetical protein